ncbi:methylmalonyl-CoA mutase family protein [Amycolatopsis regifaucium]|uniref:Methylmalonyl-CoA mutase n=1 Tax=Amycolatopsis regifaucium TaxID=546365 RepID=A0A154MCG0_9PSEU|nr:methylmalonyl-CoA mutase family protein [Amycolatopsis regifaucium]KZB82241.1 methylmalonyl-CoA mutase [Amycolatopsis regifaucium]OKA05689.1 methylmalonyl-CoA mutase [Amycolatopsis regifaucium]SFG87230.1 methylmalonyl-CoA mutase [Amycolatopsis regifaucium]
MTEVAETESVRTPDEPDAPEVLKLAAEFPEASREQWRELVAGVLRKSGAIDEAFDGLPESKLVTRTYDGLEIQPLYTAEDTVGETGFPGLPPFVRSARPEGSVTTGWDVRARYARRDAKVTNTAILADLEGGVSSVWLRAGAGGVPVAELADALNEVYVDLAPVTLDAGEEYEAAATALFEIFAEREIPASAVTATLGADPIGLTARTGTAHPLAPAAQLASRVAKSHPKVRTIVADGLPFHEAGGSDAQELGAAIAAGVAYLRALTEAGLAVDTAAGQLEFRLAATADQFLTIAKFRAARRLWARVTEVSGGKASGMRQHAVTSPAMLTQRDPWVNMLRTTVACFGAGVGGADAITVLPFDAAIGQPDAFSARIARNTHAVLLEESKLAGVIDPAGGSWYVENLTGELAKAAWHEFTAIEAAGGIEAELASGALAGRLAETWEKRSKRIATRRDPITGVSEFPNLTEKGVVRDPVGDLPGGGLPRHRYAEAFEALRDRADAQPSRPRVFLATLGPVAAHTARASFAANLFQAGGIEAVNPGATEDIVAEFRASGTKIACLCGSDTSYAEEAASVAKALKEAGATSVLLAGKPGDYPDITDYLFTGCDALEVLTGTLNELGVQ